MAPSAVALFLVVSCGHPPADEVESETVVPVKAERAERGDIRAFIHVTGVVTPAPGADLVVVAPETAKVAAVPKASGEVVHRGDVLVRFEIPASAAEVERQAAEVTRAKAAIANATAAQTRAGELYTRGVAARKELEDAERALADASAAFAQARASLGAAQATADRAIVRATFDGVVAERRHNAGDIVEASASDPVLRVIDPHRLEVLASIPLADAQRIDVGSSARLTGAPAGEREPALTVLSRPVLVEPGTASVPVRLGFTGFTTLATGTPVQLAIAAEQHTDTVLIPAAALVREGERTFVFVTADGKAHRHPVTVGLRDPSRVEILSGVGAGELVIVDGQAGLPDGAGITMRTNEGRNENEGT
jgi:RND family efflux transporter MFP subunit